METVLTVIAAGCIGGGIAIVIYKFIRLLIKVIKG